MKLMHTDSGRLSIRLGDSATTINFGKMGSRCPRRLAMFSQQPCIAPLSLQSDTRTAIDRNAGY